MGLEKALLGVNLLEILVVVCVRREYEHNVIDASKRQAVGVMKTTPGCKKWRCHVAEASRSNS